MNQHEHDLLKRLWHRLSRFTSRNPPLNCIIIADGYAAATDRRRVAFIPSGLVLEGLYLDKHATEPEPDSVQPLWLRYLDDLFPTKQASKSIVSIMRADVLRAAVDRTRNAARAAINGSRPNSNLPVMIRLASAQNTLSISGLWLNSYVKKQECHIKYVSAYVDSAIEPIVTGYAASYIRDALIGTKPNTEITLEITDKMAPLILHRSDGERHWIMPTLYAM